MYELGGGTFNVSLLTIENGVLTATLKIRRAEVESRFGALAERLGREAAEQGRVLVYWAT